MMKISNLFCFPLFLVFCIVSQSVSLAQDEEKEKEGQNPIGKFFRNLDKGVRNGAKEIEEAQQGRDQLDSRPPQNQDFERRLEQAKSFLDQSRIHDAIQILQYLNGFDSDFFLFDEKLQLVPAHKKVAELFRNLPEEAKRNYLNRFEPVAQQELTDAFQQRDRERLTQLSKLYRSTPAARDAALLVARNLVDQGNLVAASKRFQELAELSESENARRRLRFQAIQSASLAGDTKRVQELSEAYSMNFENLSPAYPDVKAARNEFTDSSTQLVSPSHEFSEAADPQFIPLWTHQTIDRYDVESQISKLFSDLRESKRAIVPTSQAIIQGDFVGYRTLRSLEVRNLKTGELVWENRSTSNIEARLSQSASDDEIQVRYRGRVPEHHPVTSLLLRDAISRSLTSDGRHLFAVENHESISSTSRGYAWQRRTNQQTPEDEKYRSNEIVAYDFATGRIRWRIGGKRIEAPFSRPLAGTFFFGPPISDGTDLFLIGEQEGIVSLFSLNGHTGEVLWSQELASPSRSIVDDQVRRFWPCYPSVQDGIIVCPTTCGWLVAVDQVSHQLLWASRFPPRSKQRQRFRGGYSVQNVQDLNRRWLPTPPVILGNSVIVAPSELPNEFGANDIAAICFDLHSGEELWRQVKGDGLYLAGVFEKQVIFVGRSSVIARNVEGDGRLIWKTPYGESEGNPSGRSVIIGGKIYVPIEGNRLVDIQLKDGSLGTVKKLTSSEIQLGHLYYGEGKLISLSAFDLSAFPARKLNDDERLQFERSFVSELVSIEYLVSNKKYLEARKAIQELRSLPLFQEISDQERRVIEELDWDSIEQIVLQDEEYAEETLFELQTLASTPEELMRYKRLAADYQQRIGEWKSALSLYLSLLEHTYIVGHFIEDGTRKVRCDLWVAGRIQDLYHNASESEKETIESEILLQQNSIVASLGRNRAARQFHYLPFGQQLEIELALVAKEKKNFSEALVRLQRVATDSSQTNSTLAWGCMAQILSEINARSDSRRCWQEILDRPEVELQIAELGLDGMSHSLANQAIKDLDSLPATPTQFVQWGDEWEAVRTGTQGRENTLSAIKSVGEGYEFLNEFRWLFQNQYQRLRIENSKTGEFVGSFPLRSMTNSSHRSSVGVRKVGSMSYAVHRGAIHAMHFPEQQVAWTFTPDVSGLAMSRLRSPSQRSTSLLSNANSFRSTNNLNSYNAPTGILLTANEFCALVIDEDVKALDPLTGELLWSDSNISKRMNADPFGDRFIVTIDKKPRLVRMLDGQTVEQDLPESFADQCILLEGTECVQFVQDADNNELSLQRGTVETSDVLWKLVLPEKLTLIRFNDKTIGALTPEGEFSIIDLNAGKRTRIGAVPEKLMEIQKRIYAYADNDFIFIAVSHGNAKSTYVNLPSLKSTGTLLTFSKKGGLLWSQDVAELSEFFDRKFADVNVSKENENDDETDEEDSADEDKMKKTVWGMNLIVKEIEQSPVLIFISSRPENRNKVYFRRLTMIGLDKKTGKQVFDWNRISNSGGFSYLHVNTRERYIDMRTYNERLKIQPVQPEKSVAGGAVE